MLRKTTKRLIALCILYITSNVMIFSETIAVFYDSSIEQIKFAAGDVKSALEAKNFTVEMLPLSTLKGKYPNKKVVIALASNQKIVKLMKSQGASTANTLGEQAYCLCTTNKNQQSYWVLGGDANGDMYGGMQIAENIKFSGFISAGIR